VRAGLVKARPVAGIAGRDAPGAPWTSRTLWIRNGVLIRRNIMDIKSIPHPALEECFQLEAVVDTPVVAGQSNIHGRRQLIIVKEGTLTGKLTGCVLPGGVDSQIIRPDGFTELSARYALELEDGKTVYVENNGIRRVDPVAAPEVAAGKIVDPKYVYFAAVPKFEVYDDSLRWLEQSLFVCYGTRLPDRVLIRFYRVL